MNKFGPLAISFLVAFAPAGSARAQSVAFDAAQQQKIVAGVVENLKDYFDVGVAAQAAARVQTDEQRLIAIGDPEKFAAAVTDDLYAVTHDKHLRLNYSVTQAPVAGGDDDRYFNKMARNHSGGVRDVKWLRGNIGYVDLAMFGAGDVVRPAIDGVIEVLGNTDALIIDLRRNGGGDPSSLDYMMGYFFEKPVELTSIDWVRKHKIERQFSAASVDGVRYLGKPLYVLTSARTFSCAEQFAYDMLALHRATLIGETTGGGANPGEFRPLNEHFAIFVPTGRALNPYTKTNWEGTGVRPDVPTPASAALVEAYTRALKATRNSFDVTEAERQSALSDPAKAIESAFSS